MALKGFWLGAIAQSHPSATSPFPNVHYTFWTNLLQWMVDHNVYTWFGYVVIGDELLIAVGFISAILSAFYRPFLGIAAVSALVGLLFHFWFLMGGSAGVNALMPFLAVIAAVCLFSARIAAYLPVAAKAPPVSLEPVTMVVEKVPATNGSREPVTSVTTRPQ